ENNYAANSTANARNWQELCDEFNAVRRSTLLLFKVVISGNSLKGGSANNKQVSHWLWALLLPAM
ncbi:MAG: hypothetical protein IPH56_13485, partial [Chitinophagaceae bacterium]|nr:hypothetical protein [Chitinophagaceae bacterium]